MTEYAFEAAKRSSTSINWSFAAQTFTYDASTPFSNFIGAAYQSTVQEAFALWASVSGLTFTQVADSASVPIRIGFESFAYTGELGETDFLYDQGAIANDTRIRLLDPAVALVSADTTGSYSYQYYGVTLLQVALHEIGHALGLDHTTDPATVMYPYASIYNQTLSAGDIEGVNTLYFYFTVVAAAPTAVGGVMDPEQAYVFSITRHSDPSIALTIGYSVTGAVYPTLSGSVAAGSADFAGGAYPSGQVSFAAGSTTATLSVMVVGNPSAPSAEGFAIALSSLNPDDSVTVRGQVNAVVLNEGSFGQISGNTLGIYRFFDTSDGTHFYTASQAERNTLIETRLDLIYEGPKLTAVASPSTDGAAVPVYRFFDLKNGTHFYSISPVERDTILATRSDLAFEGTAFYEHGIAQTGDTPVYRFFDATDGTHFFTASASERASILATRPDLHDEGVGFYAPSA